MSLALIHTLRHTLSDSDLLSAIKILAEESRFRNRCKVKDSKKSLYKGKKLTVK